MTDLFSPCRLFGNTLRNRLVMAPMTRLRASAAGVPTPLMAEYYLQRVGAGLIVTEATVISPEAVGRLCMPGIYDHRQTAAWAQLVAAVQRRGGTIALQLQHAGRVSHSSLLPRGRMPVAPSALGLEGHHHTRHGRQPFEIPHALNRAEIAGILRDYRAAAGNALAAGFDGVEIAATFGDLIDTFLQSCSNRRGDDYGGDFAGRARFLFEVIEAVLSVLPARRVGLKISPNCPVNGMGADDNRELFLFVAGQLGDYGLGYLHITDGPSCGYHEGPLLTLADLREVYDGVLIGNGGYSEAEAQAVISEGLADLVSFGRLYISNPDLEQRFARGLALNPDADEAVFYAPGAAGYTDFAPAGPERAAG